ncbi:Polyketide cyclase/dehydrase and lipid transport superfamily protein [Abeliophyllum distichum]|uniref:Polyketide cyclase/dehydrase and lipid transport superfamily protein n=1 Tax=Abeliophyllum distichum TaxID=126358 RepID=A0ABD1UKJ5_9LAMI
MEQQTKWKATVSTRLENANADQIWPFFKDFFGLHKWFPGLPTCYGIHGSNGEPGCIRYCAGFSLPSVDGAAVSWCTERLIEIDHVEMSLSYEIVDCNTGFMSYIASMKIVPAADSGGEWSIEWCFEVEPLVGWRLEDLVPKYESGLQLMVKKMEAAVSDSS